MMESSKFSSLSLPVNCPVPFSRYQIPSVVLIAAALSLFVIGHAAWINHGPGEQFLRLALRETARVSLLFFLLAYIARPLLQIHRNNLTRWLMQQRRYLGIGFGISHLVHFVLIVSLIWGYADDDWYRIAPLESYITGGIAYLFAFAMLATSNDLSVKRLGRKAWKRIHTLGMHLLYVVFLLTFVGLLETDFTFYIGFVSVLLLAGIVRLLAWLHAR